VYYTSLSNMLCIGFMFLSLVWTLFSKRDFIPRVKFAFSVMIAITAIVYNLFLNKYTSAAAYFAATKNGLYHLLRRESMSKGVSIDFHSDKSISVNLHIIVDNGVNLNAVGEAIISEVRYVVQKTTKTKVRAVNVFIDSMA
jgi:uncharacterized alkaline shock family protein YloU